MGRSSNLQIQIDAQFTGEGTFKSAEASAKSMARELDRLETAARSMAAAEAAAYREADAAAAAHEAAVRKMATAEMVAYREIERAAVEASRKQHEAMTKVGTAFSAVGGAALLGMGIAGKAAMDWESAWAGVTKTVEGTPEQLDAVEGSLRQLAKTLPATHEEIAGVAEASGQLGVKTKDIVGFTDVMIDLGETTNLTAEDAATGLAKLMNVMGTAPKDVERLGSTLVALGNDGASTEADILSMAQRISGAGKLVGASESDVLALSNALSSVGIEAELGGGVMTRVMQKIYGAVKEGGDGLAGFAEVAGMSSAEFTTAWETSPVRALDAVFQGLNRVEGSGGNVVETLSDLGLKGTEEASVLLRMKGAGDLLSRSLELGNTAWAENNALQEEAAKRYATSEARVQMARNAINDAAIDIGGNLLPAVAEGADFVANLAAAFGSLSEGQQDFVTTLGAGAAGVTGLVGVAAVAIPKVAELKTTLDDLAGGSSRLGKGLGTAMSLMTGPWGLALAGATVLVGAWAAEQGAAAQRVKSLSEAIDGQTGAFSENARALVAKNLEDKGALSAAQSLGLQLDVVTDAALGQADAMRQVQAAAQKAYADDTAAVGLGQQTQATLDAANAASLLERAVLGQQGETDEAVEAAKRKAEAMGEDTSATAAAGDASEVAAGQVDELGRTTDASAEAVEKLGDAIREALGQFFDVENATAAVEDAIDGMTDAVRENGSSTDLTTEKGRANVKALQDRVTSAGDLIAAMAREGQSSEELSAKTQKLKEDFLEQMRAAGFSQEAIAHYADAFDEIPAQVQTTVKADTSAAQANLAALTKSILGMPSVTITPELRASNSYYANRREGAVVDYYADGGIAGMQALPSEDHVAQIAPAGSWRVWAEPETGGEAYVPLAEGKRGRSKEIVQEVVGRFGGRVEWYANGGLRGAGATGGDVVSRSLVMSALTATTGPVDDTRHAAALAAEALAAERAAAAERLLGVARTYSTKTLELYKAELGAAEDALDAQHEAAEAAIAADIDALKKRNSEAERLLKERQGDELDALRSKTKDAGRIKAAQRSQEAAERALAERNEAAEQAAQDRLVEVKKGHKKASEDLAKANDRLYDGRKAALAVKEADAEQRLTDAKEAASDATDELRDAEEQLNAQREQAIALAERVLDSLTRGADLGGLFGDTSARDLDATAGALTKAAAAADDAARAARGEDGAGALSRRTQALSELADAAAAFAVAQQAMNVSDGDVQAGLDAARRKVTELGAAYGLTADQVGELTAKLDVQRTTGAEVLASFQREAARSEDFGKVLEQLLAAGIDEKLFDQIEAGGTTTGLQLGRAILAGGADMVAQFNAVSQRMTAAAQSVGATVASARFSPGLVTGPLLSQPGPSAVSLSDSSDQLLQRVLAAVVARPNVVHLDGAELRSRLAQAGADDAFAQL